MTPEEILQQVRQQFGDAVTEGEVKGAEVRLTAKAEAGWEVCRVLRDVGFEYLNCVSGADWMTRLEVVYDLSSLQHPSKVHLRVPVNRDNPVIRTVTDIWRGANWHERECYDLFGVRFDGPTTGASAAGGLGIPSAGLCRRAPRALHGIRHGGETAQGRGGEGGAQGGQAPQASDPPESGRVVAWICDW
jgi:Ni,Fe-hydrogenase III component G